MDNPIETAELLADAAKDLEWIVDQLGMKSLLDALSTCFIPGKPSPLATLLRDDATAREVIDLWRRHLGEGDLTVLEMLAFERWFSLHPNIASAELPGHMQFDKTLHVCRQHVGIALYEHAREVNWRRPFVFTRTLALAREYLLRVVAEEHLTHESTRRQFLGKAAVATILISRFEPCEEQALRSALELLETSMAIGNPAEDAMPYLLEGAIRLYDLTGEVDLLLAARKMGEAINDYRPRAPHHLGMAEIWLRLAEASVSDRAREVCILRTRESLAETGELTSLEPADQVRLGILMTFTDILDDSAPKWHVGLKIRNLRTPFGLAEHAHDHLLTEGNTDGLYVVERLLSGLKELMVSTRGEPICRRVLADLLSAVSVSPAVDASRTISALREAIRIRQGISSPLTDEASRIRQGNDLVRVAALTDNQRIRKDGVLRLLKEASADPNSCNPLVILGKDVETHGPLADADLADIARRLHGQSGFRLWLRAIARGDHTALYRHAAARAIRSPDVRHRHLGGRSNALTVEDHLGLSTDTFVFKRTTYRSCQLELDRAASIERVLTRDGLADKYGLVDHIAVLEEELNADAYDLRSVMTVRRFARGSSLAHVGTEKRALVMSRLIATAQYLAHIHALEKEKADPPTGMRKELKTKEVGRWLKVIVNRSGDRSYFERWWDVVRALPAFPRRDAHAFNWIITDEEKVLAVDLEAVGWRPVGYELAQLTDDVPVLECTDEGWGQRLSILAAYSDVLAERGATVDDADLFKGYVAGLTARAVRALSDPGGSRHLRLHGQNLLRQIKMAAHSEEISELAGDITRSWARRLGNSSGLTVPDLADARRGHISRALAYHLRHSAAIPKDAAGWAPIEILTEQLRKDGLRVSAFDVLAVAAAIDETRFETSESHVRAMYGHSVPVDIDYQSSAERPRLFHATPMPVINSIFQGQGGLQPMTRQWVHVSSEWRKALQAGGRKGAPVLLSMVSTPESDIIVHHAGGTTWLANRIPPAMLALVPIYEMFEWDLTNL